jgi:hypothetical protein
MKPHPQPIIKPTRKPEPPLWVGPLCFLLAIVVFAAVVGLITGYTLRK